MDWSGMDYLWIIVMFCQLFGLSFWRHPFTAEDPLVSKWCEAISLKYKQTHLLHLLILVGLRVITFCFKPKHYQKFSFDFKKKIIMGGGGGGGGYLFKYKREVLEERSNICYF